MPSISTNGRSHPDQLYQLQLGLANAATRVGWLRTWRTCLAFDFAQAIAEEVDGSIFSLLATEAGSSLAAAGGPLNAIIIATAVPRQRMVRGDLHLPVIDMPPTAIAP